MLRLMMLRLLGLWADMLLVRIHKPCALTIGDCYVATKPNVHCNRIRRDNHTLCFQLPFLLLMQRWLAVCSLDQVWVFFTVFRSEGAGWQCGSPYFCLVYVLLSSFCPTIVPIWSQMCPHSVLCPVFDSFLSTLFSVLSQSGLVFVIAGSVLSPFCPLLSLNFMENLQDKS